MSARAHKNEKQGCVKKDEKYGCAGPAHRKRGRGGLAEVIAFNINLVSSAPAHKNEKQENVTKQELFGLTAPAHKRRGSSGLREVMPFGRGGEGSINK